jgi:hypothetical protein
MSIRKNKKSKKSKGKKSPPRRRRRSSDGLNFKKIILNGMRAQSRLNFFNLPQPLQPPLPLPQLK